MRIIFLIAAFLFLSNSANSQIGKGLVLEYDIFENEVTYKRNGLIVHEPSVKEGENIYVSIVEFNPYLLKADVDVIQLNYNQSSTDYEDGGMDGNGGGALSGISGLLGGLSMGSNFQQGFGGIPGSRGAASEDVLAAKSKFSQLTQQLEAVENKINKAHQKIKLFETTQHSQKLALEDIEKLKENEYLRPSRIKELIEEEINYSFAKTKGEEISIDDLVNEMKKKEEIEETISQYQLASKEYTELASKWKKFSTTLFLMNQEIEDLQVQFIKAATDSISTEMSKNIELKLSKPLEAKFNDDFEEENINKMAALRQVYEEMQSNIFTYSFPPIQAKGDEVSINISISKKTETGSYKDYKKLTQSIPVTGGWKISAGLGLGFGVLKDKTYEYSIVNNKIVADAQDDFVPLLVSFAHAYKKTERSLNFGGSFGIGFPMQGGNTVQSITFFLGPTIIIGKSQKFLITTGVMGAKVNRLSSGFKPGDTFDSISSTLPTNQRYELGYFVGISYDLL